MDLRILNSDVQVGQKNYDIVDKSIIKSVLNIDKTINVYSVGLDNVRTNSWL